jgi:hypothetical protein
MPNRRKFTEGQKRKWLFEQQEGHYAGAANQKTPPMPRSRAAEVTAIDEFIRTRGVKRVPTPHELEEAKHRQPIPDVTLPDDEEIPA